MTDTSFVFTPENTAHLAFDELVRLEVLLACIDGFPPAGYIRVRPQFAHMKRELDDWLQGTSISVRVTRGTFTHYGTRGITKDTMLHFENENDAILFKLRWL